MRKLITGIGIALVAASCRDAPLGTPVIPSPLKLEVHHSPAPPFDVVTAGPVQALIPHRWQPEMAPRSQAFQEGVIASPAARGSAGVSGAQRGLAAVWVDGARVGVPSDYYYLAATGPALDALTHSKNCSEASSHVFVNHRPEFFSGHSGSPGDYVARGGGTCRESGSDMRWAYYVAAPGFGPVRSVGIPSSGLYIVAAVLPDSPKAHGRLAAMLAGARFAGAGIHDFIAALRH
ncbi:MAG: hypothetical protein M3O84_04635 [Actinomycetota bacterium]|nr:hypothetical protein [Actinomycetota bacterium]